VVEEIAAGEPAEAATTGEGLVWTGRIPARDVRVLRIRR
jgi:hypothetical protein